MAEYKLGRIRFVWKDQWTTATTYYVDDVVRVNGKTYICVAGHTSSADINTDLAALPARWNQFTDGQSFEDEWQVSTLYQLNDVVKYGGNLYICTISHTSAATTTLGLEANSFNWSIFVEGIDWKEDWNTSTRYKVNDVVRYGGYTYLCKTAHTSNSSASSGLEADQSKWDTYNPGIEFKGVWNTGVRYKLNDVVKYGSGLWICITHHTSGAGFSGDSANWNEFVKGLEFDGAWVASTEYQVGTVVTYGGNQYIAKTIHSSTSLPPVDSTNWDLFNEGFNFANAWSVSTDYRINDVVTLAGYNYLAVQDSPSTSFTITNTTAGTNIVTTTTNTGILANMAVRFSGTAFGVLATDTTYFVKQVVSGTQITLSDTPGGAVKTLTTASGSMTAEAAAHPSNTNYWQVLTKGIAWSGEWQDDREYDVGEAVRFGSNAYICVQKHRSEGDDGSTIGAQGGGAANSRPDLDSTGTYWNVLCVGSEIDVLTTKGDLVFYSDAGPTRLPVGEEGQILRVSTDLVPEWVSLASIDHVYFVAPTGSDLPAPVWGKSFDKPWKSIRYACEQVEQGPRNPNAQYLLERNRVFIQKEVSAWIRYQIDNAGVGSIWENFDYDEYKCERDVGFIVDRLIWDIGHGGNQKMRAAAQSFVDALGEGPFSVEEEDDPYLTLALESSQGVAAYNYMLEVVEAVLDNESPAVVYQNVTDDSTAIETQYIDADYTTEAGVFTTVTSLVEIVTNAIEDQDSSRIPEREVPQVLIRVATGRYTETLPIVVPAYTCILGDELRSTRVGPAGSLIDPSDAFFSIPTFDHLASVISDIVTGTAVTPTSGNTQLQDDTYPVGDTPEGLAVEKLVQLMKHQADFKTRSLAAASLTDPVGYDSSYLIGYGKARKLIRENKKFFQEEIIAWLAVNYSGSKYQKTLTRRDVGYIVDAIVYDLTYDGNALSVQAGLAYFDGDDDSQPQISASIKALTIAAINQLKAIMQVAAVNGTVSALQSEIPQFRDTAGSANAATLIGNNIDDIIAIVTDGPTAVGTTVTLVDPTPADGVNSTTALINEYNLLEGGDDFDQVKDVVEAYLAANYTDVDYSVAKSRRDAGIVLKAIGFDMMFNSNYQTIKAAYAYLRPTSSELFDRDDRIKEATRNALIAARDEALSILSDSTAESRLTALYDIVDTIIYSGSTEGDVCQTNERNRDYAILKLEENRDFIVAETSAYIADTYSDTAVATTVTTNLISISDTSWLARNAAIRFTGTTFGGITADTTYYVQNIVGSTTFTIAESRYATAPLILTTASGSMGVELVYDSALCLRDVGLYIDALKWDLRYTSNYKSTYVARYYANAVLGSLEEDMYYLRDATGVRDQTLEGLTGDMTPENAFGTSRVTAGAYCSLDPGWGPADFRTWIISRSPYVQGVTTFGNAAVGQKIDGALHDGGNDSIVSNDFTQVISDGIGAWITNNGRAELVSVFSYYAHIGYLAEAGGRIRGTNGNNSYGDFGSVAEGVDPREVPGTAVVDNKFQFEATVGSAFGDGSKFFQLEFDNAGIDYTEVEWAFTGGGISAASENDEFRDDAVYQVRLLDFGDDSSGQFGGEGYLSNANTSQGGTSTSITLAATDGEISGAYVGMVVYITGGAGVGQYGIVSTYNAGTKAAAVLREDGSAGWEHVIPGTAIVSPDASSTYVVEPRISFSAPGFSNTNADLPAAGTWSGAVYGSTNSSYVSLTGTYSGTSGSGATFTVIRNGYKYISVIQSAGAGYNRLETITIAGTSLGGLTPDNNLVLTITAVNSSTGAILEVDQDGYGIGGTFVAVQSGSRQIATSQNGTSWTNVALALPSTASWSDVTWGSFNDGSTLERTDTARFVAIATGSTSAAYSTNGVTWTASTLPASASWSSVTFGNGRFVAIASDSTTVAVSFDGEIWDVVGTLPSTGFVSVAYGAGTFVAVKPGDTGAVAYSSTGSGSWTADDLPASSTWSSVTWGNNKFVAVASDSNDGAYSFDGENWSAMTVGAIDGSTGGGAGYQKVRYGQGLFMTTAYLNSFEDYSYVVTSENGIDWTVRGVDTPAGVVNSFSGWNALAFGTPQRTGKWAVLPKDSEQTSAWIRTGAKARARAFVAEEKIFAVRITEPGSGYDSAPTMTITDPNNVFEAPFAVRIGKGVLGQPSWTNRGTGYSTASAEVDTGDGYADFFQAGAFVAVRRMSKRPVPGSNVVFAGLPDRTFKLVNVLTFLGTNAGAFTSFYQVSPELTIQEATSLTHLSGVETRLLYSQVRLTGHDFLDIGTGSFTETNYPGTPTQDPIQANETVENNGGRVFFTATDQDGNFRVGDLFSVEQATGIATLNADAFNISGLQELSLGNVTLGGGSATITEFSTDPFFTADSDNIVPTQRAIKAFIANQIGGGGAALNVNSITAGSIKISSNVIENITGAAIKMNAVFEFRGGVTGLPTAFHYFLR